MKVWLLAAFIISAVLQLVAWNYVHTTLRLQRETIEEQNKAIWRMETSPYTPKCAEGRNGELICNFDLDLPPTEEKPVKSGPVELNEGKNLWIYF